MLYYPPLNSTPTPEVPEPSYDDGDKSAGRKGSIPSGKGFEAQMREILNVIDAAGLTRSGSDLTQLLQAIQIIAGGVGGAPASFGLNPVFPEVITNGGVMSIAPSTGQVVLATGQQWIHRGGTLFNSTSLSIGLRTLSTVASKTYHMRWRYNAGSPTLLLYDLADVGYNPGAVAEADAQFDTTYDDMLIAKVVTDGSNVPTVTALTNLNRLASEATVTGAAAIVSTGTGNDGARYSSSFTLNWARSPKIQMSGAAAQISTPVINGYANRVTVTVKTRYSVAAQVETDFNANITGTSPYGSLSLLAVG